MHAKYHVTIPTMDELGQPLHRMLPTAAHQWLYESQPRLFHETWVEGPHAHSFGPAHHLVTVAEDSPETDSYVKQLAAHVGQIANHPVIAVGKHGEGGMESWPVANKSYQPGVGASPELLDALPVDNAV